MQQHTTQFLLPSISQRIAAIDEENYAIPIASNKRNLKSNAKSMLGADGFYAYAEEDYADAKITIAVDSVTREFVANIDRLQLQTLIKINHQLDQILCGSNVSTIKLRSVLSQQQYTDYLASLDTPRHSVEAMYGGGMPQELKDYNIRLRNADFVFNKYEKMAGLHSGGKRKYKMHVLSDAANHSQGLYESALERLEEIFSSASGEELQRLHNWMDRDVVFGTEGDISIDYESVPRVRGSKSHQAQNAGLPKLSKRHKRQACILDALMTAAIEIAFVPLKIASNELNAEQTLKVRDMLSKLKFSKR